MANKIKMVVALGGNALQANPKDMTPQSQLAAAEETAKTIVKLLKDGYEFVLTHGNGPQVGQIIKTYEEALKCNPKNVNMPLCECGAMSEGYIGYHLQNAVNKELKKTGLNKTAATIITQTIVDKNDKAFQNPTKPIGSFFTEEEAKKLEKENGYIMKEDAGRGYRRVVPSPIPVSIIEAPIIRNLMESDFLPISCGGGGIPVILEEDGNIKGVEAVIDKDFASSKIASMLDVDLFVIITAVDKVCINFNKPDQKELDIMTIQEAEKYIAEGHFAPGSMLPKIQAALMFIKSNPGKKAIITSIKNAEAAIKGNGGTVICN